ncbi:hypothetical protein, partial [Nocardioides bruguierae]
VEAVVLRIPEGRRGRRRGEPQVQPILVAGVQSGFPGRKPEAWTRWVLDGLGYDADLDVVDDLFPGSGAVTDVLCAPTLALAGSASVRPEPSSTKEADRG